MDELQRAELARPAALGTPIERARAWLEWFGAGRLLLIAVSVALVGAGGYWLVAPPPPAVEASLPMAPGAAPSTVATSSVPSGGGGATSVLAADAAPTASITTTTSPDIVVHVAGAVVAPGVHRLPAGARVADAVGVAGGPTPDAHTDAINLAAPLADGDRIHVPTVADDVDVPAGVTHASRPSGVIDGDEVDNGPIAINTATVEQLEALPGVGPATAMAIVAHREQHGPFRSIDGLADVRGIGPAKLDALRPMVTL